MMTVQKTKKVAFRKLMMSTLLGLSLSTTACSKSATFSLMSDQNNFQQNASETNGKIDVLFVIDNSGSMASSQQKLAESMSHFIELFTAKGFDYRIAVTTTDTWRTKYTTDQSNAKFKDGGPVNGRSFVYMITPQTPRVNEVFMQNILQGTGGNGDERAFESMERTLTHSSNADFDFPRADAFMSVIVVSDEEDFSNNTGSMHEDYNFAGLYSVDYYINFLDTFTGATPDTRSSRYNVNSISIKDQACLSSIGGNAQKIARRYVELAQKTNGISGSICEDFGETLASISSKIVELITQFYLDREPVESTLQVFVNGVTVPKLASGDPQPWNGFLYHPETNSVTFHGNAVPPQGATISVKFDPKTIK